MTQTVSPSRRYHEPTCPLRPGQVCGRCQLGVTGPQDCPIVDYIMNDDEMHAAWLARNRSVRRS